ncbi:MAG: hypothetical protein PSY14_09695 [bacterium]|nr:hypothetical protein [bacterium]
MIATHAGLFIARPASRFIARHSGLQRIVRRVPIVTKFLSFFVPGEMKYDPPKVEPQPDARAAAHRARLQYQGAQAEGPHALNKCIALMPQPDNSHNVSRIGHF